MGGEDLDGLLDDLFSDLEDAEDVTEHQAEETEDDELVADAPQDDDGTTDEGDTGGHDGSDDSDGDDSPVERPDTPDHVEAAIDTVLDWMVSVKEEQAANLLIWMAQQVVKRRGR